MEKHLLILANSYKAQHRCVAGREVTVNDSKHWEFRDWVRPVSTRGEGELGLADIQVSPNRLAQVLDFSQVPLTGHVPIPCQPENWQVTGPKTWKNVSAHYRLPDWATLSSMLEEHPHDLWWEPDGRSDRVSPVYIGKHPLKQSLYIVKPEALKVRLEQTVWDGQPKKRSRLLFRYNGHDYDLGITDPDFSSRHCTGHPAVYEQARVVEIESPDPLVCVSLTRVFNGYHYKVAATIFEGQP